MEKFLNMFIHIGHNVLVSDKNCIGIFNIETIKLSMDNNHIIDQIDDYKNYKTISLNNDKTIYKSEVSSFSIIKRKNIKKEEFFWSKNNDKKL